MAVNSSSRSSSSNSSSRGSTSRNASGGVTRTNYNSGGSTKSTSGAGKSSKSPSASKTPGKAPAKQGFFSKMFGSSFDRKPAGKTSSKQAARNPTKTAKAPAKTAAPGAKKAKAAASPKKATATAPTAKPTATTKKTGVRNTNLQSVVKSVNIQRFSAKGKTTFCNQAVHAIASKLGYKGFGGLVANQMISKMGTPGSGFRKVSAQDAINAAKQGKLVVAGKTNNTPRAGRPDGKAPGHVAVVTGEFSPGVPGIAQAGRKTFGWGSVNQGFGKTAPSYFVKD